MKHPFFLSLLAAVLVISTGKARAEDPTIALREEIAAHPETAPAALTRTLKAAGPDAAALAVPATTAALKGLGRETTVAQVASIIYAAVRAVPKSTLRIVRAAVKIAPSAAPEIAAAAARAVSDPWKEVRYRRENTPATANRTSIRSSQVAVAKGEPDFKSATDHALVGAPANSSLPPADDSPEAILDPAAPGTPMTLAEAIVATAFDAAGQSGYAAIQAAVDAALFGDPGALFNEVRDPRGISGVGTAGNSNIANEPKLPGPTTPPTTVSTVQRAALSAPVPPSPPPVSP